MIWALAIGRFDGMHLGHFELFKNLGQNGGILLIDTKKSNLTMPQYIARYTDLPVFTYELESLKELDATEFVSKLKADFPALKKIVVGDDFRFAANRSAGTDELKNIFDGETTVVPELKIDGKGVHSKLIRAFLLDGNVKKAAMYLGRNYEVCGSVVKGQGIGAQKLVATINLNVNSYILPKEGVYATFTEYDGNRYPSVTFVGHRLSTDGNFAVETHILDNFCGISVANVWISFVDKVRDNRYFEGIEELKKAIENDIRSATFLLHKS